MAYGAILGQKQSGGGMTAEIVLNIASSNYTGLSTVSPSGTTLNGTIVNGFWTITGITEYGDYIVTASGSSPLTIPVTVNACQQYIVGQEYILNNNTWETIAARAADGTASNYWAVGDAKQITLNGTIGAQQYTNYQPYVYILGFNHNASIEGNNLIHFGCFRSTQNYTSVNGIALDDQYYNTAYTNTYAFHMNTSNTNTTDWSGSTMRKNVIGSDALSPTDVPTNSFLNRLPSDLKAVIKQCNKYTGQQSNSTADWAFLLSTREILGDSDPASAKNQQQYQYYQNGNSTSKYTPDGSSAIYWTRTENQNNNTQFYTISGSSAVLKLASYSYGFAPAFCVG